MHKHDFYKQGRCFSALSVPVKVSNCLYQTCLTLSTSTLLCLSFLIIIHSCHSLLLCCTWPDTPW